MVFNSLHFLVFFLVVVPAYFALPHRFRWLWLLLSSCYFYMVAIPAYLLILVGTIVIDYWVGLKIGQAPATEKRKWLWLSIAANVGILVVFKYLAFFTSIFHDLGLWPEGLPPLLQWVLPLGLSFHTLQAMSYTLEVYYGRQEPERHLGIFALYVLFFPQLVAGPIERPQNMLHQFREKHVFSTDNLIAGGRLLLWGLFKKVVIADRLAVVVDGIYAMEGPVTGPTVLVATLFFSIQILCDFSGYTDMARGTAKIMGFELMENFNAPYAAANIGEFWRRWHMSLSTWLRDYVYIPLGGNAQGFWTKQRNLAITFLVSGLWHGANWTFVVWGGLHALFQFMHQTFTYLFSGSDTPKKTAEDSLLFRFLIYQPMTFMAVALAWIFFRANDLGQATGMLINLFGGWELEADHQLSMLPLSTIDWCITWGVFLILPLLAVVTENRHFTFWLTWQPNWVRAGLYYAMVLSIVFLGYNSANTFIYFQF